jgi:hypothetical protein
MRALILAIALIAGLVPAIAQDAPRPRIARQVAHPMPPIHIRAAATSAPEPAPRPAASAPSGRLSATMAQKNPILVLQQFSLADLQAALTDAQGQTPADTIAANCYQALIAVLGNPIANPLPAGPGVFQLLQKGRDLKNAIANLQSNSGPLTPLATGCAPLILDGQATLIQLGILSGAVIGGGMLGIPPILPLGSAEPGSWLAYQQARDRWLVAARQ